VLRTLCFVRQMGSVVWVTCQVPASQVGVGAVKGSGEDEEVVLLLLAAAGEREGGARMWILEIGVDIGVDVSCREVFLGRV
jgi:hypothetical protein